ncbi:disulfide bond formation protein B [Piscinibacter sp. XHJ-5]|uniref:disulfide bond formation protein B n=1 Tax=Piscinibacter sp. XHJ-5 TaxID=3037797 RepID=UPI00245356BB|nr:disulfide bond formation protein B [Piscinibacter sp. XHJ-5]
MPASSSRQWLLAMAALCAAAVAAALVSQHAFGMQPCPWCILQRLIFVVVAAVCVIGAVAPPLRKPFAGLALLLAAGGVTAAVYQHAVAAKSSSCALTMADKIITALGVESLAPWLFQVTATCADAAIDLFGVPYEYWSLGLFVLLGVAAVRVLTIAR